MKQAQDGAWQLLSRCQYGVLASQSIKIKGYPLGSVTPYVLDADGAPILLISEIAQHTANLIADHRCSLTVLEESAPSSDASGNVQAKARLCLMADARPLSPAGIEDAQARYLRFFPEAKGYFATHDFNFWRLTPTTLRYIGGFGQIHWLKPEETLLSNPFAGKGEEAACVHMNNDHADALSRYCELAGIACNNTEPEMVGVDAQAIYLRVNNDVHRLAFRASIDSMDGLRKASIAMCQPDYWRARKAA